jgi:pimeloyl-ACP methyl ester carboxylesterase
MSTYFVSEAAASPALVLVHGANHRSVCWQPTIDELARLVPDRRVVAVDLPGRGAHVVPADEISFDSLAASVVADIEAAGAEQVILVGHSLGGVTIANVAARLGPERVTHLVFVAATIPPEGKTVLDTFGLSLRLTVPLVARRRALKDNPRATASRSFCNGMTDAQRAFVLDNLCPDAPWLLTEPVDLAGLPPDIDRSWVLTTRDRAVKVAQQRKNIANLGGVGRTIEIDTCHDVMVSEPAALAEAIVSCSLPVA